MDINILNVISALIGFVVLPYTVLTGRLSKRVDVLQKKVDQTYTKRETREIVETITNPIKDNTERLIDSQNKLIDALHKVELRLASNDNKG